ncbi:hypothetical protein D3C81_1556100 [compost metagenome]
MRGLPHALILDVRQVGIEMRLWLTPLANPLQHHVPNRLLGLFTPTVPRHQVQAQVNRCRGTGTGDQVPLIYKQMIDRCGRLREPCAECVQHIPMYAHGPVSHHAGLRQCKSTRAYAQQTCSAVGCTLQPVAQGLGLVGIGVVVATTDSHIVEFARILHKATGNFQHNAGTRGAGKTIDTHDFPRGVNLPAAAAQIGR